MTITMKLRVEAEAATPSVSATKSNTEQQRRQLRLSLPPTPRNITPRCTILSVCFSLLVVSILAHLQTASSAQLINNNDYANQESLPLADDKLNQEPSFGLRTARQVSSPAGSSSLPASSTIDGTATKDGSRPQEATPSESSSSDNNGDDDSEATTLIIDYDQRGINNPAATPTGKPMASPVAAAGANSTSTASAVPTAKLTAGGTDQTIGSGSRVGGSGDTPQLSTSAKLVANESAGAAEIISDDSEGMRTERDATQANPSSGSSFEKVISSEAMDKAKAAVTKVLEQTSTEFNATKVFIDLFAKKPYSQYWSVEKKWEDVFDRVMALQDAFKNMVVRKFQKDAEKYADIEISSKCAEDLMFVQNYTRHSSNVKWLFHMFDSSGKGAPGLLTGNLADLGHVVQCVRVRAPARASNETFKDRFFQKQTETLGERFRGKYCLISLRPVLPEKPRLVSRFSNILDGNLISNISYMGDTPLSLKRRLHSMTVPEGIQKYIDREKNRLDQVPFASELYEHIKQQRNFMYSLPKFMGVCYPSSCTKEDIRFSIQKTFDEKHLVADIEFDCEQEDANADDWTQSHRVLALTILALVAMTSFGASLARNILVDKMDLKYRSKPGSSLAKIINVLDFISMDKCAGILFVKTHIASPVVDKSKLENNRSTSIDALKGLLLLLTIYSMVIHQGCLGLPFMWAKWTDAMFPFFRSYITQIFLNVSIWAESFYIISAYLIGTKFLENNRPTVDQKKQRPVPDFFSYTLKRYLRLAVPMLAFMLMNYLWPRLSNGFVMQDQAKKLMAPCDDHGWTNFLMFHNHNSLNETCLWPSHVSASFFQLHVLSFPILTLLLYSLRTRISAFGTRKLIHLILTSVGMGTILILALFGLIYPALKAESQELVVPFLIDYLDKDNYKRVIEWTVLPTYNHLTSYMAGLILAYLVVRKRLDKEIDRANEDWGSHRVGVVGGFGMNREGSIESVVSSSTQELSYKPAYKSSKHLDMRAASKLSDLASSEDLSSRDGGLTQWISGTTTSLAVGLVILVTITVSWFWNGLGNPMSFSQNFWYVFGTKLFFTISFGYLFYKHIALRRNSPNPFLIIRFLVPIGRMSLTAFYVSFLVIWFDLLSSLYQWHPSLYFATEKFNEIIFITLIISMFAYGAFEGSIKKIQYLVRALKFEGFPIISNPNNPEETQGFESLFIPINVVDNDEYNGTAAGNLTNNLKQQQTIVPATSVNSVTDSTTKGFNNRMLNKSSQQLSCADPMAIVSAEPTGRHLSIADQYKVNAELRANNSFAPIGLYEFNGAAGDLTRAPSDPQVVKPSN